jgi:molecular chaperone GrpE
MTEHEKTLHGQIPIRPKTAAAANDSSTPGAPRPGHEPLQTVTEDTPQDLQHDGAAALAGDLSELVKVAAERDEYLALAQRSQADFENYRKRMAREAATAQERGVSGLARELLPALDNLDRALESADADDPLLKGVRLVRTELAGALARAGIESFSPVGEVFDPALHEAVATAPQGPDGAPAGSVVEVYQDGYRLGESILRPARVVVAA